MTKYEKAMVEQLRMDRDDAVADASKLRSEAKLRVAECSQAVEKIRELHSENATLRGLVKGEKQKDADTIRWLENENEMLKINIRKLQSVGKNMLNVIGDIDSSRGYLSK